MLQIAQVNACSSLLRAAALLGQSARFAQRLPNSPPNGGQSEAMEKIPVGCC